MGKREQEAKDGRSFATTALIRELAMVRHDEAVGVGQPPSRHALSDASRICWLGGSPAPIWNLSRLLDEGFRRQGCRRTKAPRISI